LFAAITREGPAKLHFFSNPAPKQQEASSRTLDLAGLLACVATVPSMRGVYCLDIHRKAAPFYVTRMRVSN